MLAAVRTDLLGASCPQGDSDTLSTNDLGNHFLAITSSHWVYNSPHEPTHFHPIIRCHCRTNISSQ